MKGFIEITTNSGTRKQLININSILRVYTHDNGEIEIITKELISRYECSNDNSYFIVKESYDEIKELIKNAQ